MKRFSILMILFASLALAALRPLSDPTVGAGQLAVLSHQAGVRIFVIALRACPVVLKIARKIRP